MHEVHPLMHAAGSWRDFFVHIGTIAVGLLLALGLEQAVLAVHHYQQRLEIERQMDEVLHWDLLQYTRDYATLSAKRAYLTELKDAINSRLQGGPLLPQPPLQDPRSRSFLIIPSLAPYEIAKQDGTIGLLPNLRQRQYARISLVRDFMLANRTSLDEAAMELEAFQKRYVESRGFSIMGAITTTPRLDSLSATELTEYRVLVARLISIIDVITGRLDLMDLEIRRLLLGARTEEELMDFGARPQGFGLPPAAAH
jgi:hypothetical protein